MGASRLWKISAIGLLLLSSSARAQPAPDCAAISNDADRLACYDKRGTIPAAPTRSLMERIDYARELESRFLGNGADMVVSAQEMQSQSNPTREPPKLFPRLTIAGRLDRAAVHQMVTAGKILESAQEFGFNSVAFLAKGRGGRWVFDLSRQGQLPACDIARGLCVP